MTSLEQLGYTPASTSDDEARFGDTSRFEKSLRNQRRSWQQLPALAIRATGRGETGWVHLTSYYHGLSPIGIGNNHGENDNNLTLSGLYVDCSSGKLTEAYTFLPQTEDGLASYDLREVDPIEALAIHGELTRKGTLGFLRPDRIKQRLAVVARQPVSEGLIYTDESMDMWRDHMFARTGIEPQYTRPAEKLPLHIARHVLNEVGMQPS